MRSQWCREHIDETAQHCGLEKSVVSEVKIAAEFCTDHSAFAKCGTRAITALIRIRDEPVKELAISLAQNALNDTTPTGGRKRKSLTEREIKNLIQKAEIEIHGEPTPKKKSPDEKEPHIDGTPLQADSQNNNPMTMSSSEPQPLLPVISGQGSVPYPQASGTESDHDRRVHLAGLLHHDQETNWKPRHIPRPELISVLKEQYFSKMQVEALKAVMEMGKADDEIDAILWIVDRFQESLP
jgi:hypothetical protein